MIESELRDMLRTTNELLDASEIKAKNYAEFNHIWRQRAQTAEVERDRMRVALTEIRNAGAAHSMPAADMVEAMRDIAKAALGNN